ncbi:hypothetical protein O181_002610 [Austropuccinia psidii MF-1]|uniref:Uncharacterized protein n=1 Tax=Austropuccinia psidii MF-1 TaxID=1389203 RepID=A0A9Q3GD11_9BASI|nr:hypothetical protein [Austropuccinia psidii MF-1]
MPGPNAPDMKTVGHFLSPLVDNLLDLVGPLEMKTFKHAEGCKIEVRLLTLIGDTGATHKVGGVASHSERYYCSWCLGNETGLSSLPLGPARIGERTREQEFQWQEATKTQRAKLVWEHGIHWSKMNRLTYQDPVRHMALGYMHNWLEGVLAHHFHKQWGFKDVSDVQRQRRKIRGGEHQNKNKLRQIGSGTEGNWEGQTVDLPDEEDESSESDLVIDGGELGGLFSDGYWRGF